MFGIETFVGDLHQISYENDPLPAPSSGFGLGVAEAPLTDIAVKAFRSQIELAGPGYSRAKKPAEAQTAECGRCSRRVGDSTSPAVGR